MFITIRFLTKIVICILLTGTISGGFCATAQADPIGVSGKVRIGLVFDMDIEKSRKFVDLLRKEVGILLGNQYDIKLPDEKIRTAAWSTESVVTAYDALVTDPKVDIIVAIGPLISAILAHKPAFPKPLILLGIMDYKLQNIPLTEGMQSGTPNLTYLLDVHDFERDLELFYEIFPYQKLTIITEQKLIALIPETQQLLGEFTAMKNSQGVIIGYDGRLDELFGKIPQDADAVLIGGLYSLPAADKQQIIDHINRLKLPSYAFEGVVDVKRGVLAGSAPETNIQKIARRIALNIEKILDGEDPAEFPTLLTFEKRLTLNMQTARKIDFSPNWATLASAELIGEELLPTDRMLDLKTLVEEALKSNLTLEIERQTVRSAKEDISQAQATLLPSLEAASAATRVDEDSAGLFQAEETTTGSLTLNQIVYSEQAWSNLKVQKHLLRSAEAKRGEVLLDTILEAGVNYLTILRSKTNERIRKNNLDLVRKNYEVAAFRQRVGYSGAADVYRWQSELATATSDLLAAQSELAQAKINLNEFLLRPLGEPYSVKDVELSEELFQPYGSETIRSSVDNPKALEQLTQFLIREAQTNLPELKQLKESLAAQERILKSNRRQRYLPTVGLQTTTERVFSRSGTGADLLAGNDSSWRVGLNASWSLFEGGGIRSEVRQARAGQDRLRQQLHDATRKIELRLRSSMLDLRVRSANLQLTKSAAEAARQNYQLVREAYVKGAAPIVNLLDAQNSALAASQAAANSVYEYFINLLQVERAMGSFSVLTTQAEQKDFLNRFQRFVAQEIQ